MYFRPDFCLLFAFRRRLFDRVVQHQSTDLKDPSLNPSEGSILKARYFLKEAFDVEAEEIRQVVQHLTMKQKGPSWNPTMSIP